MKKLLLLAVAVVTIACQSEDKNKEKIQINSADPVESIPGVITPEVSKKELIERGQKLFDGKGQCKTCHMVDRKVIGPALIDIAKIYQAQNGDMVAFLREKADPIVDPSQYAAMQVNLGVTKRMPIQDVEAIVAYIQSFAPEQAAK